MLNSAVQLTFPCPTCGGFVTSFTFRAAGPCPSCGTQLEVSLDVRPVSAALDEYAAPETGKKFDKRRFRPAVQPRQAP